MSVWFDNNLWWRLCPLCENPCSIKTKKNAITAIKKQSKCITCARKPENNPRYGKPGTMTGKKHSQEAIIKIKAADKSWARTQEFRLRMQEVYKEHHVGRTRLSNYQYILLRDGKDAAEAYKVKDFKRKSLAATGKNNPMYGKPSPMGSGYGWKGWLDEKFFRSLRELKFMLDNPEAISAETKYWTAEFVFNGVDRTTRPDFILEKNKIIVECKPQRLHSTPQVLAKKEALSTLAISRDYQYLLVDPGIVESAQLQDLISSGRVRLTDKTKDVYIKWLKRSGY